jgi:phosphatidylserine/phosphatidylglycerophosphate/cardiolipin synthase-like enzyme
MLDWFRENDRNVYKTAVSTLASNRKLRPVFIQKKSLAEQYAWIQKTLQIRACDAVGEQILQAYLMAAQQSMLGMFCDGLGIAHDGKGSVVGALPKELDKDRLDQTVEKLVDVFDPKIFTLYLRCFNMQVVGGYPELTEKIESDERLTLT